MCVSQNYNRFDKGEAKTHRKHTTSLISTTVIKFHLSADDTTSYNQRWNTGDSYFECAAWYPNIPEVYSEKPLLNWNINLILRAKILPRVLRCLFRWCLIKANSIKWWWSSCCIIIFFQYVLMLHERMGFLWWTANVLWQLTLIVSGFRQQTVPCPATLPDRNKISVKKNHHCYYFPDGRLSESLMLDLEMCEIQSSKGWLGNFSRNFTLSWCRIPYFGKPQPDCGEFESHWSCYSLHLLVYILRRT